MKILCPIDNSYDIDVLDPKTYNTEFFFGYIPIWWIKKHTDSVAFELENILSVPINNRNDLKANVTDLRMVEEIVKKADANRTDAYLVLNAKYYPEYVYDDLKLYLDEIYSVGVRKVIACDIGIISYLEDNYPEIKVAVSCLNQISNSKAVSFYLNFSNVTRIVFPRHMAIEEITKIASCYPNIEFEYFIFSNKCLYDDGYCRSVHAFTPICKDLFYNEFYSTSNKSISDKLFKELNRTADEYRNWSKSLLSSQIKGCCTPNFACSACSLVKSNKYKNIISVKISIRGHSIEERKRQVDMAKKLIDASKKGSKKEIQSMLCKLFGKEDICSSENHCMMK